MIRRAALVLMVLALGGSLASTPAQAVSAQPIWVFGDSIAFGSWLANPATQSWPAQLDARLGPGQQVRNLGVGGQAVAYPDSGERMDAYVLRVLASTPTADLPRAILFAGGINDLIHAYDVAPTRFAVFNLGNTIANSYPSVKFLPMTLTPYRADASYADALSVRRNDYNTWARAQYGPSAQIIDSGDLLTAGATYADIRYYTDFLHPDADGAGILAHGIGDVLVQKGLV